MTCRWQAKSRHFTLNDVADPEFSSAYTIPGLTGNDQFEWNVRRKQEVWERSPVGKPIDSRRPQLERLRWSVGNGGEKESVCEREETVEIAKLTLARLPFLSFPVQAASA